jgi:hypothetical protein
MSTLQEELDTSNPDLCLVCQLQTGVHTILAAASSNREYVSRVVNQVTWIPLEYVTPVLRPPIIF